MTDISHTKTVAVLAARPADRYDALRALTAGLLARGLRPEQVGRAGPAVDPTLDQLRRTDWMTTFDEVVDACAHERQARTSLRPGEVLLVTLPALCAVARYRCGLALRQERIDPSIRAKLEPTAAWAAAAYDAVLHVRPAEPAEPGVAALDGQLLGVLERFDIPNFPIFAASLESDLGHTLDRLFARASDSAVPTLRRGARLAG